MTEMRAVTLLGLGTMGVGMGHRLLAAGFPLTVWNRSAERAQGLESAGAKAAGTPAAAVAGADVVISMVADDAASRAVWLDDAGALAGVREGTLLIESSTLTPAWVRELAGFARARACDFIDAPVTGSRLQAAEGELLFLAGGEPEAVDRAREVMRAMGRDVVHLGPAGSGAFVKLVNNFLGGVQVAALAEAVALIEASDLDRDRALDLLLGGAPGSPLVKIVAERMRARDYDVHFRVDLMRKDLTYATEEAAAHGLSLETAEAALGRYRSAIEHGLGEQDMAAIVEPLRAVPSL